MALISPVTSQNDDLQRTIEQLHYQGAEDILVNAPQQSAYGYQVGYNHPELQYTLDGKRYYVLWLTEESKLAQYKAQRIAANDPEHGGIEIRTVREYEDLYPFRILNSYVAITDRIECYESPLHVS